MLDEATGNLFAVFLTWCSSLGTFTDNAMKTSHICHTSLSFLMNCDAKIKWHQKDSRNLVKLLVMLVSTSTSNFTGVNGAPDNVTQQQEKWLQREGFPQIAMDSALQSKSIPSKEYKH